MNKDKAMKNWWLNYFIIVKSTKIQYDLEKHCNVTFNETSFKWFSLILTLCLVDICNMYATELFVLEWNY